MRQINEIIVHCSATPEGIGSYTAIQIQKIKHSVKKEVE